MSADNKKDDRQSSFANLEAKSTSFYSYQQALAHNGHKTPPRSGRRLPLKRQ